MAGWAVAILPTPPMNEAVQNAPVGIEFGNKGIKESSIAMLELAPSCIGHQISELNEA